MRLLSIFKILKQPNSHIHHSQRFTEVIFKNHQDGKPVHLAGSLYGKTLTNVYEVRGRRGRNPLGGC